MRDYKKIAEEALKKAQEGKQKKRLNENVVYPEGLTERMHPQLEDEIANDLHSLGKDHPCIPSTDDGLFVQTIMGERFNEVTKRYKRAYDVDSIDAIQVMRNTLPLLKDTIMIESKNKRALEKLAIQMIREEYDMDEDTVEIHAELTENINMEGTKKNPKPVNIDMEFKNHDEIINANEEVRKRRFLNAMIQGAAKKCSHMFHMVDDELTDIDPKLPNKYAKLMAAADYTYYLVPPMHDEEKGSINGGVVHVQFPTTENPKAIITAQAMVFPVLIHELVKGVMEILSAHGLPKNKKIGKYVINKADYLGAEPWDMRIGPAIWEKFSEAIDPDDFNLKHHIYSELAALPVREFNRAMKEILSGTKEGKGIIKKIVHDVRIGLQADEFNEAMNEDSEKENPTQIGGNQTFELNDLLGSDGSESNPEDEGEDTGWNIEELF